MVDKPKKIPMVPPMFDTMSVSVTFASLVMTVFCGLWKNICKSEWLLPISLKYDSKSDGVISYSPTNVSWINH